MGTKGCHVLTLFSSCEKTEKPSIGHRVVSEEILDKIQRLIEINERPPMIKQSFLKKALERR